MTCYTLNMIIHSIMYSYYFVSIFFKDFDKIIGVKKSITIMQMVGSRVVKVNGAKASHASFRFALSRRLSTQQVNSTLNLAHCLALPLTDTNFA